MILAMKKGDFSMREREMNELEREERRRRQQRKRLKQRSYSCQKREWRSIYQEIWGRTLVTQLLYGTQEITTYKLVDYTDELASQNQILEKDGVFSLEFCQELCEEVFDELY